MSSKRIIITESQYQRVILQEAKNDNNVLNKVWISYGTSDFNPERTFPVDFSKDTFNNKPEGGTWACPVDSNNGWVDFCSREGYLINSMSSHFLFKLDPHASIYTIDDISDMEAIAKQYDDEYKSYPHPVKTLNFKLLKNEGYDGIYITEDASYQLRNLEGWHRNGLYSWDVESICVWNSEVIIPLKENEFRKAEINHNATEKRLKASEDEPYYDEEWWRKPADLRQELMNHRNLNVYNDSSKLFNGIHPGILAQGNDMDDDTLAAKHYNGTKYSAMNKMGKLK